MEPKWFRPHDVAEGHEVCAVVGGTVVKSAATSIDNDGHCAVRLDEGGSVTYAMSDICHATVATETPTSQAVRATAALRHDDERNTVKHFSRSAEGQRTRLRAMRGELTPEEIAEIRRCSTRCFAICRDQ